MAPDAKEDPNVILNRLAVALAKREAIVSGWETSSSRKPRKTQEELDAEDALLFRNEPPHLGVGAPLPAEYLVSEAGPGSKSLRAKFFPTKGLKASKARNSEEKAASARRAKVEESSDDEGGRSSLGRAKKLSTQLEVEPTKRSKKRPSGSDAEGEERSQLGNAKKRKTDTISEDSVKLAGQRATLEEKAQGHGEPSELEDEEARNEVLSTLQRPQSEEGQANNPTSDGMTAKERRKLKKREKKKLRKLKQREATGDS